MLLKMRVPRPLLKARFLAAGKMQLWKQIFAHCLGGGALDGGSRLGCSDQFLAFAAVSEPATFVLERCGLDGRRQGDQHGHGEQDWY